MGPPPSRAVASRKRVLDEDAYTEMVEAIIERDFFPELPKLQNKLEWLEALQSGAFCMHNMKNSRPRLHKGEPWQQEEKDWRGRRDATQRAPTSAPLRRCAAPRCAAAHSSCDARAFTAPNPNPLSTPTTTTTTSTTGDPSTIRRAQINIARRRAGLKTPLPGETPHHQGGVTGARFTATPGTALFTPAMTPLGRPATGAVGDAAASGATPSAGGTAVVTAVADGGGAPLPTNAEAAAALAAAGAAGARAPKMSLDAFLAHFTGEDNASFEALQEAAVARKRARHAHHLEGKNAPPQLEGPHATDGYGTGGQAPGTLTLWRFEPKNALYYDTSERPALALTAAERAAMVAGPPKGVRHAATRLAPGFEEAREAALAEAGLGPAGTAAAAAAAGGGGGAAAVAAVVPGGRDPAELVAAGAAAAPHGAAAPPRAYLRTPSLAPGVGASPLVTWGDVAATPLRLLDGLGPEDGDLAALGLAAAGDDPAGGGGGPQFRLPEVRRREAAANAALEKRKAAARRGSGGSSGGGGATPGRAMLTPGRAGAGATPLLDSLRRTAPGTPLSSAAQRLAAQLGKGGGRGTPAGHYGGGGGGGGAGGSSTGMLTDSGLQRHLRASYGGGGSGVATPLAGRTPLAGGGGGRAGSATPGAAAVLKPRPPRAPPQPAGKGGDGGGGGGGGGGQITDGLLRLPPQ